MDKYESTFNTWNKVALLYQEKFMDIDLYNDSYDIFCELLPAAASILEIGCGPGSITRYLLRKDPGYKITGIDVADSMIKLARINNPSASFMQMDCRELEKIEGKYEGVMCGFCLPYLSKDDTGKLVKDMDALLKEKGIFYLSYIEGLYKNSGFETASTGDQAYVYYHQEDHIAGLLKKNNFITISCIKKKYPEDGKQTHTIFIAQKS